MRPIVKLLLTTLLLCCLVSFLFSYGYEIQSLYILCLGVTFYFAVNLGLRITCSFLVILALFEIGSFFVITNYVPSSLASVHITNIILILQLLLDLVAYYLIKNKQVIALLLFRNDSKKHGEIMQPSISDAPLLGVFMLFCIFDFLLIGENLVRNLDRFGISEEFAKQFWHWDWFYYASQPVKLGLQALTIMILFAGIYITRSRAARGEKPLSYDDCSTSN